MNLYVIRFVNQLMNSNCFIVVDNDSKSCIIIDPASEESEREIKYIEENSLTLDYILLTHAHADHCWGVNILKKHFPKTKLAFCDDKYQKREIMLFFRMWHEDANYNYDLISADVEIKEDTERLWQGYKIRFVLTPGHSLGSMCIEIDGVLFTGDTIMPFPPYFNGRGSDKIVWEESVKKLVSLYKPETKIYPGHGETLTLEEWVSNEDYSRYK